MPQFAYRARAIDGSVVRGFREAPGTVELARGLRADGLALVRARPEREQGRRAPDGPARVLFALLARNPRIVEDTLGRR